MSLSDCVHCWETPCTCGYEYRNWSKEARIKLAATILGIDKSFLAHMLWVKTPEMCLIPEKHPWKEKDND
jgi:hypothetical protein